MNLVWALSASIIVSLISLIGACVLFLNERLLNRVLLILIGFSAGTMIGAAFLDLLPESIEMAGEIGPVFVNTIIGFVFFFFLERYLHWRHCHEGECHVHAFSYLNLIGDGIHNFLDGLVIGATFLADIRLGIAATLAIILHEIPQEIGDFGVLVYGGFSRKKALFWNFVSGLTAVCGTLLGYYFAGHYTGFVQFILPVAAGGFIYIAGSDLIPEIHKQANLKQSSISMFAFVAGILLMYVFKLSGGH